MNTYYIMSAANKEKPGSGCIEQMFDAESDKDAKEIAKRHYEGCGFSIWAYDGVNREAHIKFRFLDFIDKKG